MYKETVTGMTRSALVSTFLLSKVRPTEIPLELRLGPIFGIEKYYLWFLFALVAPQSCLRV